MQILQLHTCKTYCLHLKHLHHTGVPLFARLNKLCDLCSFQEVLHLINVRGKMYCTSACAHTHTHTHTHKHTFTCTHTHEYIHVYTHIHTHTHIHVPLHTPIHTHTCTHTYTTCTYAHTHTHIDQKYFTRNKYDISCLKNQPDAFPVQYTQLSLGQAISSAVEPEMLYS